MSAQMRDARAQMEENEDLSILMSGLRGSNLDQSDFAAAGTDMSLIEVQEDSDDRLPLVYDAEQIAAYWARRPVSVVKRILQLLSIGGGFLSGVLSDVLSGNGKANEVLRAVQLRDILTSLGPAYIKLGQALSIRPDVLSPPAMNELQKLCDKVPSFPNEIAMATIEAELGAPASQLFAELSEDPIAAASLGQVYKGKLFSGETVAVKVQRPYVLETVTIDLFIIRAIGEFLKRFPDSVQTDVVALLDEWALRFFEELDYEHEANNAIAFARQMERDLPQVVVPTPYLERTSRRVLTTEWLEGEKLARSSADDVGDLVNLGVICYLKQLLDTGFFHADPHPGNLIRTPDGRLAVLDFGLMTPVEDDIKYGMIEAISHLIHRDYDAILNDFVTLQFIPKGTDLQPIKPVLAKVFDQALEGGGAKGINFQDLAADLAQITFDYPFRIPPYFAIIIRAIGVLEGIALGPNPDFAIIDEAYPYISKMLLTSKDSPRLQEALRYMVYGKEGVLDADRLIDILVAFETFKANSQTARGDMDAERAAAADSAARPAGAGPGAGAAPFPFPFPFPFPPAGGAAPFPFPVPAGFEGATAFPPFPFPLPSGAVAGAPWGGWPGAAPAPWGAPAEAAPAAAPASGSTREALKFVLSPDGEFFREFLLDEVVKSVDALSRDSARSLVASLGLEGVLVPVVLPGVKPLLPLAPTVSDEDRKQVANVQKIVDFLTGGTGLAAGNPAAPFDPQAVAELGPLLPSIALEIVPELNRRLVSRIGARLIKDVMVSE